MKVKLAKTAGFCMGVHRAMELMLAEANKGGLPLYSYGPLIHNQQVLDLLESKGVRAIDDIKGLGQGRIVIRAHGISPEIRRDLKNSGLKILDATCPRVARVQALIRYHTRKGCSTVIVGDEGHAEVIGLMGFSEKPVYLIQKVEHVESLPHMEQVFVVAQTTQDEKTYEEIVEALKLRFPNILVFNTICEATHQRQQEVRSLADQVDAMVVVGGHNSGNTRRLVQISREADIPTYYVSTESELDQYDIKGMDIIGVTAGASTPNWMIKNVVNKIESMRGKGETLFQRSLVDFLKLMELNKILPASGVFSFAYAALILLDQPSGFLFPFLAFLYIYSIYILNRFLDKGAAAYNDPESAKFLRKHGRMLSAAGIAAISVAIVLSYNIGMRTFLAMSILSMLGIIYSIPIVPGRLRNKYRYHKIKDISGSKTLAEGLGWMSVIVILPLLEVEQINWAATFSVSFIVFSMSVARSIIFDFFQLQGDLIVGTETLPITLGERRTFILLKIVLTLCALTLILAPLAGILGNFSYMVFFALMTLSVCLIAYERRWFYPGNTFDFLVEGNFFLLGVLSLVWQLLT